MCVLQSGEVLVVGGYSLSTGEVLASVEVFNPAMGVWCAYVHYTGDL